MLNTVRCKAQTHYGQVLAYKHQETEIEAVSCIAVVDPTDKSLLLLTK